MTCIRSSYWLQSSKLRISRFGKLIVSVDLSKDYGVCVASNVADLTPLKLVMKTQIREGIL